MKRMNRKEFEDAMLGLGYSYIDIPILWVKYLRECEDIEKSSYNPA